MVFVSSNRNLEKGKKREREGEKDKQIQAGWYGSSGDLQVPPVGSKEINLGFSKD